MIQNPETNNVKFTMSGNQTVKDPWPQEKSFGRKRPKNKNDVTNKDI